MRHQVNAPPGECARRWWRQLLQGRRQSRLALLELLGRSHSALGPGQRRQRGWRWWWWGVVVWWWGAPPDPFPFAHQSAYANVVGSLPSRFGPAGTGTGLPTGQRAFYVDVSTSMHRAPHTAPHPPVWRPALRWSAGLRRARGGGGGVGLTSLHLRWPCDATSGAIKPLPHPIHPPPTLLSIVSFTAVSPPTLQRCWPRGRSTAWHCKVRLRRATCVVGRSYRHAVLPPRRTGAQAQQDGPCGCCICAAGRIPQGGSG
jgi:hypothetical protein